VAAAAILSFMVPPLLTPTPAAGRANDGPRG
jgi:hypothetical protein